MGYVGQLHTYHGFGRISTNPTTETGIATYLAYRALKLLTMIVMVYNDKLVCQKQNVIYTKLNLNQVLIWDSN